MEFFCGLDVAIEETAVCVVDDRGEVHLTVKVATEPEALFAVLKPFVARLRRVGHEAGSLSPWLHPELLKLGLPVICLETQHVRAAMSAQRNKTDEKDALGIAHIMRTGWFRAAHVKSEECYRMRLLLTHRRNLKRKFLDLENAVRHSLKSFGIKLGGTSRGRFDQAVREAAADNPLTAELTSRRWQSGTSIDVKGRISKAGDADVRRALYEAASGLMTRFKGKDKVKTWGQQIAKRSCHRKAVVAVARKLAVIMHAMWSDGTFYVGDAAEAETDAAKRAQIKARKHLGAHA